MSYLVVGLGNVGDEYQNTRHNIGFDIVSQFAEENNVTFTTERYGDIAKLKIKGKSIILLKPSTYMNLSGNAVRYWMQKEKIKLETLLILVDDLSLPFGTLRLKPSGSAAGHNGLKHIQETLNTEKYARIRFGLGNNYNRGQQIDFVIGKWTDQEQIELSKRKSYACEMIKSFCLQGIERTMNIYNKKKL